ncbi:Os08g0239500 [Oryza sativa Japonica Group]|uniref:Os08g0239500 protein n=1 Tax=Oryza sativa subsp. japonica TaxID=39947 RepID=A0A0P0XDC7_ORYSJ|nr:Os08g0239500 [Oryza sativa Japonica Group]
MPWWTGEEEVASLPPQVEISTDMVISEADGVLDLTPEQVIALCGGISWRQLQRASMQRPSSTHGIHCLPSWGGSCVPETWWRSGWMWRHRSGPPCLGMTLVYWLL